MSYATTPPTTIDRRTAAGAALAAAIDAAMAEGATTPADVPIWAPVFQGISDMRFMGRPSGAAADAVVADNTPAARLIDRPPRDALVYPTVNI